MNKKELRCKNCGKMLGIATLEENSCNVVSIKCNKCKEINEIVLSASEDKEMYFNIDLEQHFELDECFKLRKDAEYFISKQENLRDFIKKLIKETHKEDVDEIYNDCVYDTFNYSLNPRICYKGRCKIK